MEGKLKLSNEELQKIIGAWLKDKMPGMFLKEIVNDGYGRYNLNIEIEVSDQKEEEPDEQTEENA